MPLNSRACRAVCGIAWNFIASIVGEGEEVSMSIDFLSLGHLRLELELLNLTSRRPCTSRLGQV